MQMQSVEHRLNESTGAANCDLCVDSCIYTQVKCRKIENVKYRDSIKESVAKDKTNWI